MNQLYKEISEQPDVFQRIADSYVNEDFFRKWGERLPGRLVITGMGSSLFALYPAFLHLHRAGLPVSWVDASELLHYGMEGLNSQDTLLFASQSGESYELIRILERLSDNQPRLLAVTAEKESTVGRAAHDLLDILSGSEKAVTSTKTHSAMVATANLWALALTGNKKAFFDASKVLTTIAEEAFHLIEGSSDWMERLSIKKTLVSGIEETQFIIARGPALASAWHGCLCFYECARVPFMSFSGGQFRHGPLELLLHPALAIILAVPGSTYDIMITLAKELAGRGANVLCIGPDEATFCSNNLETLPLRFPNEFFAPILSIIPFELFAYHLALEKGIEPGTATLISKTTSRE